MMDAFSIYVSGDRPIKISNLNKINKPAAHNKLDRARSLVPVTAIPSQRH